MNELLGFAVLSGPLWFILILVPVAIWLSLTAAKRFKRRSAKVAIGMIVFLLGCLLPFGDEVTGRIYLNHLCTTQADVKIYETVELPPEYWHVDGKPKFFNKHGNLDRALWLKEIDESRGRLERYSPVFSIDKHTMPVKGKASQKVLAEVTTFRYWGGWVRRSFSPHNTADSCKFLGDPNFTRSLYGQIFRPASSSK